MEGVREGKEREERGNKERRKNEINGMRNRGISGYIALNSNAM